MSDSHDDSNITASSAKVRYGSLLKNRDVSAITLAANLPRLSSGLIPFGFVAFFSSIQNYRLAGIALASVLCVNALTAPYKGRIVTRISPAKSLVPMALIYGALCSGAILAAASGAPAVVSVILIFGGAAAAPPTGAVIRSTWTHLSSTSEENRALHALDSIAEEFTFAIAPIITTIIWVDLGARWVVPVGSLIAIAGTGALVSLCLRPDAKAREVFIERHIVTETARVHGNVAPVPHRSLYTQRNVLALLIPMLGLGVSLGALAITLPNWSRQYLGNEAYSGIVLGIVSFSGALFGILAGQVSTIKFNDVRQYQISCGTITVAMFAFWLSSGWVTTAFAAILLGAGMTPMFISSYVIVGLMVDAPDHTELNAALGSGFNIGNGLASFAFGFIVFSLSSEVSIALAAITVGGLCSVSLLLSLGSRSAPCSTVAT